MTLATRPAESRLYVSHYCRIGPLDREGVTALLGRVLRLFVAVAVVVIRRVCLAGVNLPRCAPVQADIRVFCGMDLSFQVRQVHRFRTVVLQQMTSSFIRSPPHSCAPASVVSSMFLLV